MSEATTKGDAVCILSFDSGGPGTHSQLLIVQEMMLRMAHDLNQYSEKLQESETVYPADYFDLMGGVGFGGLAALMLGHLRMDVENAIEALQDVAAAVFPAQRHEKHDPVQNLNNLKASIEKILRGQNLPVDLRIVDERKEPSGCRVALYAATPVNIKQPYTFRTYGQPNLNPTIVEAVCASMAVPTLFSPVEVGTRTFVGGALGASNPTQVLLCEAIEVFDKKDERKTRIAQIINLGSGAPPILNISTLKDPQGISQVMQVMTADSEVLAKELSVRLFSNDAYIRFNVDRGMENISVDNWSGLGEIANHTDEYLQRPGVTEDIDASLKRIRERIGTTTLWQITHSGNIKITAKTAPPISPYHVLREKETRLMIHHLIEASSTQRKIFVITGVEGCGKTQLVSYFLHINSNHSLYNHTVFVDAGSAGNIKADLQAWARSLGDGHEKEDWKDALRILSNASHDQPWALVMDGADDSAVRLVSFFPDSLIGTIIITSRNREVSNLAKTYHLELGELRDDEGLSLLQKAARREDQLCPEELESARILIKELKYLPNAIVPAGKYCHELSATVSGQFQPYTFTQYLELFSAKAKDSSEIDHY